MRRVVLLLVLAATLSGCRGTLAGGLFTRDGLAYRVVEPAGPWRRVGFADNDLAWVAPEGHVIAVNATCADHEDSSLEVLTTHLLIGFTDRQWVGKTKLELDGREALRSKVMARLDGVPTSLDLVVLKKNDCVHDFTYVSPVGQEGAHQAEFDALLAAFRQERSP
jgi:hypothetical protein